jgi:DEAD/DEAH box helicase domain-containing protein
MSRIFYEVIFDIETQNWFDETGIEVPADLKVSVVSLYCRQLNENLNEISGEMKSFWENDLDSMWKYFLQSDRIIGFNSINFDVQVLKSYAPSGFTKLPHFDIMDHVKIATGRRVSLNKIAKDTLNTAKTDSGANAVLYWQKHDPESLAKLKSYCEADVLITRDIYDFGLKNKYLKYTDHWNNPRQIEVDFSYPADSTPASQPSLF